MKKFFLLFFAMLLFSSMSAFSYEKYNTQVAMAIQKYKHKNYVGCIQDLSNVIKKDPSSAFSHYYLALSYSQIGKTDEALKEYKNVIDLATNPTLVEYAKTGQRCIETPDNCVEKKAVVSEMSIDTFIKAGKKTTKDVEDTIKKLELNYQRQKYNAEVNSNQRLNSVEQSNSSKKAENNDNNKQPSGDEIANAIKTLQKVGINPFAGQNSQYENPEMQMLMGMNANNQNNNGFQNNNIMQMLPYIMNAENSGKKVSPEFIKSMVMSSMTPDMSMFDTNSVNKF